MDPADTYTKEFQDSAQTKGERDESPESGLIVTYFKRQWDNLITTIAVGVLLAIFAFWLTSWFENQRFEHQQILENTRFARELSLNNGSKPLSGLNMVSSELGHLDLSQADLSYANLSEANLVWTTLTDANLKVSNLAEADMTSADLANATLVEADLTRTKLRNADLSEANLYLANLTEADLTGANLTGADLTGANLTGANLSRADLTDVFITQEEASYFYPGICYDSSTKWPEDFDIGQEPRCYRFIHHNE